MAQRPPYAIGDVARYPPILADHDLKMRLDASKPAEAGRADV
jgi:hypothetical protein